MGTTTIPSTSGLADALFTPVQQRVLGLLFGQPSRRFQSAELIQLAESGTGAEHRQLQCLADSGLVTATRVGNQKHYQANPESPIFAELRGLIVKRSLDWKMASTKLQFLLRIGQANHHSTSRKTAR
jgi:hypothetical protein